MAPRNALVIANPASNHGEAAKLIPVAADLMGNLFKHDIVVTDEPEHAKALAAGAEGYDTVIALGGDGAVHEALNGLMQIPRDTRPALSVLPVGSGNDYARTLGISFDLSSAVLQIASGVTKDVDIGTVNDRYFANTLAVGVDAKVTARAVELKVTTGRSGIPLYLTAVMHVLLKEYCTYRVKIAYDGEEARDWDMTLAAFTHGPTYGGGFHITPDAIGDDGLMDVCTLDAISQIQTFWRVPFLILGKHTRMRPVTMSRHESVTVTCEEPLPGQVDGEVLLETEYRIGLMHKELRVLVPSLLS